MSSNQKTVKEQSNDINANSCGIKAPSARKLSTDRRFSIGPRSKSIDEGGIRTISDIVGDWGPYQSRVFALYITIYIIASMQNQGIIFYTDKVDFWCKLPDGIDKVS